MRPGRYFLWMGGTMVALAVLAVLLGVLVDPYRMFGTPGLPGWTTLKPRIYERPGIAKIYQLERIAPRTVLLGNSRVEIGFDPASPEWPADTRPIFNAAMAGQGLFTALLMLREAIATGKLKTAVVGIDFLDFLQIGYSDNFALPPVGAEERRLLVGRDGGLNPARSLQLWRDRLASTLTIDAATDSVETLLDQDPETTTTMTPLGFNPLHEYRLFIARSGYYGLFAQKNATYVREYRRFKPPDFSHPLRIVNYRYLLMITRLAKAHGIQLILFTPPYHADYLEMLNQVGLWASFEAWQRTLADVVDAAKQGGVQVTLFDFSIYDRFTTEPVPPRHDLTSRMRWYWESAHYKSALGDKMLKRFFHGDKSLGYELTKANVDAVLARTRSQRAQYIGRINAEGTRQPLAVPDSDRVN